MYSVTRKALDYMESFNRFPTADSTQAVERYVFLVRLLAVVTSDLQDY